MKQILFSQAPVMLHGGDYNPEQWLDRPDILEEDIRLMKEAGMNTATLGVFAWSVYEPVPGEYHFEWLLDIIDKLYEAGIYTVLGTPTGARPAWLSKQYPEVLRVSRDNRRNHHGLRHNHCMSSIAFRKKASELITRLANKVKDHPGIILWHISNELGGECYCESCQKRFIEWLKNKYNNDIEKLNHEWWTTFWSHRFSNFEEIEPPFSNGETTIHGLTLDWKRFNTWNMTDYLKSEISIVKAITPNIPVTTNFMRLYPTLDYEVMAKELDIISWDSYPAWNNDYEEFSVTAADSSFDHAMMRSFIPGKPFMLMESVPSLVNWHPYNKLKRPGVHRITSLQIIACGSDTVQYFQWRKGRGSFEQYHGAVIDHLGRSDTRVFGEVKEVGELLAKLTPICGSRVDAKAAILFDWNNRWAIQDMAGLSKDKKYEETCREQYRTLQEIGIEADVITPSVDFDQYELIVAPMLYLLREGLADKLKEYVSKGGTLIATYLTGYVNENTLCYLGGFPGDGLMDLFGLYSEEIDTLYPTDSNEVCFTDAKLTGTYKIRDFCEILKVSDAKVLGIYSKDFYSGTPVVTEKVFGHGSAYYIGARIEAEGMKQIYHKVLEEKGIQNRVLPKGIEHHSRIHGNERYDFYLNMSEKEIKFPIEKASNDLLSGKRFEGEICLEAYQGVVLHSGE